ncbi:MAG: hypothetical protein WBG88_03995 [Mesorhizobium sp.]
MPEKKHKREEIVAKLRQADVVGHRCTREAGPLSAGMKLPPNFIENLPAGISASIPMRKCSLSTDFVCPEISVGPGYIRNLVPYAIIFRISAKKFSSQSDKWRYSNYMWLLERNVEPICLYFDRDCI